MPSSKFQIPHAPTDSLSYMMVMMRGILPAFLLLAAGLVCGATPAHPHPDPVQSLGVVRNIDGSITLNWGLPPDPSVVGLTIDRERLDRYDLDIFEIVGLASNFTDTTAHSDRSYRYTVYTRDAFGNLSIPLWVEAWDDDHHGHHGRVSCHSSIGAGSAPWSLVAAILLLAGLLVIRRN